MATEYVTLLVKRGSAEDWAGSTVPLQAGEWGYDQTNGVAKMGDGLNLWADLAVPVQASIDGQLPEDVRTALATNLADPTTPEGAVVAELIAAGGGGGESAPLAYDPDTGVYSVPAGSNITYDADSGAYTSN